MRDLGSFRDFSFRLEYQGQEFGNFAINSSIRRFLNEHEAY